MKAGDGAVSILREFEGFSTIPYDDIAGYKTIGIGHRIKPNEYFTTLTKQQAKELLDQDLKWSESAVNQCLGDCLINQNQFDALICFVYNLGGKSLLDSTLLKDILRGDIKGAANQFLVWDKAKVNGKLTEVAGLKRRRQAERKLFLS